MKELDKANIKKETHNTEASRSLVGESALQPFVLLSNICKILVNLIKVQGMILLGDGISLQLELSDLARCFALCFNALVSSPSK